MFQAETYIQRIQQQAHGEPRLSAMAEAIAEADAASAHNWRLYFRYEYIRESIFHEDNYKAIIRFPEFLQIFDEHPELEDDYADDMMQAFKWVLENTFDFYQVSRAEIERYFTEFEKRCRKYGFSQRVVHMKRCKFLLAVDMDEAKKEYEAFHRFRRDRFCDCEACEMNFDMRVALLLGQEAEALRIAQPILQKKKRCAEIPHCTYSELSHYYLYQGNLEEAAYYGTLCERLTQGKPEFLEQTGELLELYSATAPEHGWKFFKQTLESYTTCRNPLMKLTYARGAYRLVKVISAINQSNGSDGYTQNSTLHLLPLQWEEKGIHLDTLAQYFYDIAKEQSEKLDTRNGNTYYIDTLNKELPEATGLEAEEEVRTESSASLRHGLVKRDYTMLAVCFAQKPDITLLEQRLQDGLPEGDELLTASIDEEDPIMRIAVKRESRILEVLVMDVLTPEGMRARPVANLDEATFEQMTEPGKPAYILRTELDGDPMQSYHRLMQLIRILFPEMLGVIDLANQHAYPAEWVRFAGTYADAVTPHDLFGLYITGDQNTGEVWLSTLGMGCMGMRDLEIFGANPENFGYFADMLDEIAAQCVEQNLLADAGEIIGTCYYGDEPYRLTWSETAPYTANSFTREIDRPAGGALLVETDDGNVLPTQFAGFADPEQLSYPNSNRNFHRRIRLAKATYDIFRDAVQKPFERAAARLEFELSDAAAEEFGYGIELLWAEISRTEDGRIFAQVAETSEALPELKEGDETEVTAERIAGWILQPAGSEDTYAESTANLLQGGLEA